MPTNVAPPLKHHSKAKLLVVVLLLVVLGLALAAGWWFFIGRNKQQPTSSDSQQAADVVGAGPLDGNEQRGKGIIETNCYRFEVPRSVSLGQNSDCSVDFGYGSSDRNLMKVNGYTARMDDQGQTDFSATLQMYRKDLQNAGKTIESETAVKVDGQEGMQLTISKDGIREQVVLVRTPKLYTGESSGTEIGAFVITNGNFSTEQTEVLAAVLKSWKWR